MNKEYVKKLLMFIKGEDFYFLTYNILLILKSFNCIEDKMLKARAWWVYRGVKLGGNPSTDPTNRKEVLQAP